MNAWRDIDAQISAGLDTGLSEGVIRASLRYRQAACETILRLMAEIDDLKRAMQAKELPEEKGKT